MRPSVDDFAAFLAARADAQLVVAVDLDRPPDPDSLRGAVVLVEVTVEHLAREPSLVTWIAATASSASYLVVAEPPSTSSASVGGGLAARLRGAGIVDLLSGRRGRDHIAGPEVVLTGVEARRPTAESRLRVAAVVHVHNDGDMVEEVVDHLCAEGVAVHLFDNWSSDGTWETAQRLVHEGKLSHLERFPAGRAPESQLWAEQLDLTAAYATAVDADWVIHHDADEIRQSPWPGVSLVDALARVDELGYNAIDFTVIDFRFIGIGDEQPPYERGLRHFEFGTRPGHFLQVKGWRNDGQVDLSSTGGHDAQFEGRRIFPLKFLLKHYPLRSPEQARRKVFVDREQRRDGGRTEPGWHTQYDRYTKEGGSIGWTPDGLLEWDDSFYERHLIERLSGIGLSEVGPEQALRSARPDH